VGAGLDPAPTRVPFGAAFDHAHDQKGTALSSVPSWTFERGMRPPAEESRSAVTDLRC